MFVRVKGKNLHVECFKCATCGSSLKNVGKCFLVSFLILSNVGYRITKRIHFSLFTGYYTINDKMYCDIHARQAAMHQNAAAEPPVAVASPA